MNDHREELASLYVLDQLEPRDRAEFEATLMRDPELQAIVRNLESGLEARIRALPPRTPSASLWREIEARIEPAPVATSAAAGRRRAFAWGMLGGLAALFMVGLGFVVFYALRHAPAAGDQPMVIIARLGSGRSTLTELPLRSVGRSADARFVQLATLAEQYWDQPEKLPETLTASVRNGRGYAVFDPATDQGFVAVQHVPVLDENQRYHLWLVDTATAVVRDAGVLPLNAATRGLFFFSLPDAPDKNPRRLGFFITLEKADADRPGSPQGKVVLGQRPI